MPDASAKPLTSDGLYKASIGKKAVAYCEQCRTMFGLPKANNHAIVECKLCDAKDVKCNILIEQTGDLPLERAVPVPVAPKSTSKRPQEPGYYFWYILDISYFCVGAVQVLKDPPKHLEYLRGLIKDGKDTRQFHLYQNDAGEWLTMYHQAIDARPTCDDTGNPYVDGYRPFDLDTFLRPRPDPIVRMTPKNPSGIMSAKCE